MTIFPELSLTVTYLEQIRPEGYSAQFAGFPYSFTDKKNQKLMLEHWQNPCVSEYRALYQAVGAPYLWWERLVMSDAELKDNISAENVEIYVLVHQRRRIGYAEIELDVSPATANIAYFGLCQGYTENRIGGVMMRQIQNYLWAQSSIARVTINTCTLDHPRALGFYQYMGFSCMSTETLSIRDPRSIPALQGIYAEG